MNKEKAQETLKNMNEFEKNNSDVVITVTNARRNPYFNMVKQGIDGSVRLVMKFDKSIYQRQCAPEFFDMTTACYVVAPEFVMTHDSIFEGTVRQVNIPIERSIDIDSLYDFQIAEFLMSKQLRDL